MKIIGVTWHDTATHSGWTNDLSGCVTSSVYTVGFLVEETDDTLKLAATVAEDGQCADVTAIPKRAIVKRQVLK